MKQYSDKYAKNPIQNFGVSKVYSSSIMPGTL